MFTRRHMLRGAGGLAVAPLLIKSLAAEEASSTNTIVVTIYLQGGNDGLNTVIPITTPSYGEYVKLRTPGTPPSGQALAYTTADLNGLQFDANPATPALDATTYAFNPKMTEMRTLYSTGKLAVIAGVSLPLAETNSLSHSNATNDWMTGQINIGNSLPSGWMGLALNGMSAGSLGPVASLGGTALILSSPGSAGLVLSSPIDNFGFSYGASDSQTTLASYYKNFVADAAANSTIGYQQAVAQQAAAAVDTVRAIAKKENGNNYPFPTSPAYLDYQLRDISRLILGGAGVRGYFAVHYGFDTHSQQALYQPGLLGQLSSSMLNFYTYLKAQNASSNVIIMTISDFGRRPEANLNFGTDHGSSTVSFVLGDAVKGGVYGTYPSLSSKKFDPNGNLQLTVDFRNVLSDVIQYMGGNPAPILAPYKTPPKLGFI